MAVERKDSEWLQAKVVELLTDAAGQEPKDHAACAKYAELLYRMLPKGRPKDEPDLSFIEKARLEALKEG